MKKSDPVLIQAQDASTPPATLVKLSEHESKGVRREIAKNPNTPFDTLCALGKEFPKELIENASLPLLLLEDPDLMERVPDETVAKILQLEDVPDFFLEKIDYGVTRDALRLRKLPAKVIEAIFAREKREGYSKEILIKLASHPSATAKVLLALTKENEFEIHEGISKNKNATPEILLQLFSHSSQDIVLRNIAQNPNATEALQWKARTSSINFFPDEMKRAIDQKLSVERKKLLTSLSFDTTEKFTLCKRSLTEEQRTLLQQGGLKAKFFLVHDLGCSEQRLRELAFDPTHCYWDHTNLLPMILRHPNTTDMLREEMYATKRLEFRYALAESPQTKPKLLEKLATDRDAVVRGSVAKNENTPLDCLKTLTKDKEVGSHVAENPNVNQELFEFMAKAKHTQHAVAQHERCPPQLLLQLAASSDISVLRGILENLNTPPEAFRIICEKGHWRKDDGWRPHFRDMMRRHPSFPAELLSGLNKRS